MGTPDRCALEFFVHLPFVDDSSAGFEKAVEGLVGNLQAQLVKFREKIEPPAGEATTPAN